MHVCACMHVCMHVWVGAPLPCTSQEGGQESRALLLAYLREMRTVREKKREALAVDYDLIKTILK